MSPRFVRTLCRILIVAVFALPLEASAGLVGTDAAVAAATASAQRQALLGMLDRKGAAAQLQALGVRPDEARARIAALTDAEVAQLSKGLQTLPAGADGGAIGILLVLIFLFWKFVWVPSHEEAQK